MPDQCYTFSVMPDQCYTFSVMPYQCYTFSVMPSGPCHWLCNAWTLPDESYFCTGTLADTPLVRYSLSYVPQYMPGSGLSNVLGAMPLSLCPISFSPISVPLSLSLCFSLFLSRSVFLSLIPSLCLCLSVCLSLIPSLCLSVLPLSLFLSPPLSQPLFSSSVPPPPPRISFFLCRCLSTSVSLCVSVDPMSFVTKLLLFLFPCLLMFVCQSVYFYLSVCCSSFVFPSSFPTLSSV